MGPFRSWSVAKPNQIECNESCALHCNNRENSELPFDGFRNLGITAKPKNSNFQESYGSSNADNGQTTITSLSRAVISNLYEQHDQYNGSRRVSNVNVDADETAKFVSEVLIAAHRYCTIDPESTTEDVRSRLQSLVIGDENNLLESDSDESVDPIEERRPSQHSRFSKNDDFGTKFQAGGWKATNAKSTDGNIVPKWSGGFEPYADPSLMRDTLDDVDADEPKSTKAGFRKSRSVTKLSNSAKTSQLLRPTRNSSDESDEPDNASSKMRARSYERNRLSSPEAPMTLPKFTFNFGQKEKKKKNNNKNNDALALVPSIPGEFPDELQSSSNFIMPNWNKKKPNKSAFPETTTGTFGTSKKNSTRTLNSLIPEGFIRQTDAFSFFEPGRVFAVVWSKPLSRANPNSRNSFQNNDHTYGQVRRMISVASANGKCYCVSFSTYQDQGLNASHLNDEDIDDHIILYAAEDQPFLNRAEREPQPEENPIKVYVVPGQSIHKMSRLYLARLYAVDWQTPIMDIGTIGQRDTQLLKELVRDRAEFVTESVPDTVKATTTRRVGY